MSVATMQTRQEQWFRYPRKTASARLRLICCPPAGSGASFYRRWADLIPASIELLIVQYPGREDRAGDPFSRDLGALADDIASAASPLSDLPLAVFGHSMGAAIAHEVTRRLEAAGRSVEHLLVSGRPPPHRQRGKTIHQRDDQGVLDEIARLGGTPDAVLSHAELRDLLVPRIRADFQLIETYSADPAPRLRCPVSAFIGQDDTEVSEDEARCWADVTTGAFRLNSYPGGHFYLMDQPGAFIRDLTARLAAAAWPCTP
ncbi:thioesterase [Paracoccus caeni]|uniref:Thioesterase n=1 Tax=Paracoccus caeni TaxID=657651 RepID=A0A934SMD1_9RHOB|nr:alpha/beta fold hydrolase [Paracoccus caeni]MBK4217867.1 thioesterase [Paracoccus caeni]